MTESDVEQFEIMVAMLESRIREAPTPATREAGIAALEELDCAAACWALGLVRPFQAHASALVSWLVKSESEEQ
jgi:hypothetical protein